MRKPTLKRGVGKQPLDGFRRDHDGSAQKNDMPASALGFIGFGTRALSSLGEVVCRSPQTRSFRLPGLFRDSRRFCSRFSLREQPVGPSSLIGTEVSGKADRDQAHGDGLDEEADPEQHAQVASRRPDGPEQCGPQIERPDPARGLADLAKGAEIIGRARTYELLNQCIIAIRLQRHRRQAAGRQCIVHDNRFLSTAPSTSARSR